MTRNGSGSEAGTGGHEVRKVNGGDGPDPSTLLDLAVRLADRAAELARRMRGAGVSGVSTKSTDTDVVTEADRAVERLVIGELAALRPGDAVVAEETGGRDGAGGRVRWILDPIDGTVNYLYGIPEYAVSLAVEVDGVLAAGVVRNAASGQRWTATRGGGAWRDGRRLHGSRVTSLGQALVGTGFGYHPRLRAEQARVLAALLAEIRDIRRCGSAALDLCAAAEGRLDAYYERGLNLWDHAAGALIAAEAGLTVSGLDGADPGPDMVLAAPAALHRQLHEHLVRLDAVRRP